MRFAVYYRKEGEIGGRIEAVAFMEDNEDPTRYAPYPEIEWLLICTFCLDDAYIPSEWPIGHTFTRD